MTDSLVKRTYAAAAAIAAGVTAAVAVYAAVVELLYARAYRPPLPPQTAYALKYALYGVAASSLLVIRLAAKRLGARQPTPERTLGGLAALSVLKAAASELPAVAGLLLFLLGGFRADFYLLAVFSVGLELYNFPRLSAWQERLRSDFGQL